MRLEQLTDVASVDKERPARVVGDGAVVIGSVTHDSRQVTSGALFCCVPGARVDGHDYAPAAKAAGAAALLVERELDVDLAQLVVPSVRVAMAPIAAEVYGHPSRAVRVIGITGTNGKTTTSYLLDSVLRAHGWDTDVQGNLTQVSTNTPESPELQRRLAAARDRGCDAVVMEVTSVGLAEHRADATWFSAAVFTNLSQDHLENHGTMDAYFRAKASLFEAERAALGVINADDSWGRKLADTVTLPSRTYSVADAEGLEVGRLGSAFRWRGHDVRLGLPGEFNVSNALAAATTAAELGVDDATIAAGLSAAPGIPGRLELIDEGQDFRVVVDYAHTPDGLEQMLVAARAMTDGRMILVFGCGGDRDPGKRPLMGAIAVRDADVAVLTSDNPRSEDPLAIIAAVRAGAGDADNLLIEPDRAAAIDLAVREARTGDTVVIAGKGHETGQTIGAVTHPFDDREAARRALRATAVPRDEVGQ